MDTTGEKLKAATLSYKLKLAEQDVTQSSKQLATQEPITTCIMESLKSSWNKIRELIGQVNQLEEYIDKKDKLISQHQLVISFPSIGRLSINNGKGETKWPLYIYEMIMKLLVNGKTPSSVAANIGALA